MNSLDAAKAVLQKAEKALHYKEITRRMLDQGLWETKGKTPEATVNARLAVEIKKNGTESTFQRTKPGVFALRVWGLDEYIPDGGGGRNKRKKRTLSFTNAAEVVLDQYGNKQPMHYRDITDKILEEDLVYTEGKTPEATLYAQILTEIKRQTRRGETPRFVKYGKGYVGLRKWMGEGLAYQIRRRNREVRKKLLKRLHEMSPDDFEGLIAQLLVALGFEEVAVTSYGNDGGIDVRGTLVVGDVIRTRMAVQVKRWKRNVHAPIVQQVRGSLGAHEQGLIITTSDFSRGAREEAERADAVPVGLMDGKQLVSLLIEHDIGVIRTSYELIEMEEEI
jgi:restriction system protein